MKAYRFATIAVVFTLILMANIPLRNNIRDSIIFTCSSCSKRNITSDNRLTVQSNGIDYSVFTMLKQVYVVASDVGLNASGRIIIKNNGDKTCNVSLTYSLSPEELQGKIQIAIVPSYISIPPGEYRIAVVYIEVAPGVATGLYTLNIHLAFRTTTNGNGNQIVTSSTVSTKIMVGQHSYKLNVVLLQPDRTPTVGYIRVSYLYGGGFIQLYGQKAANFTFYVIEGRYLIEATLPSGRSASKEIEVSKDEKVEIILSTIFVQSVEIIKKPIDPRDSLIFRAEIVNEDPLIYKKTVTVKTVLKNESGGIVSNVTLAKLTIRSSVIKTILGFLSPSKSWLNGTYTMEVVIESAGKIFYNYTDKLTFRVFYPEGIVKVPEVPFIYLLLTVLMSIIFGFLGAKFALLHFRGKYIPKAVGLIYGKNIIAYSMHARDFVIPEMVSGEWNKVIYGFNILSRRYWWKKEKLSVLTLALNAEKWIFYPITKDVAYFVCVHSAFNEYDLRDFLEKLKKYFESKINRFGIPAIFADPEAILEDLGKKVEEFFK